MQAAEMGGALQGERLARARSLLGRGGQVIREF
jgi:hypothetical protein